MQTQLVRLAGQTGPILEADLRRDQTSLDAIMTQHQARCATSGNNNKVSVPYTVQRQDIVVSGEKTRHQDEN